MKSQIYCGECITWGAARLRPDPRCHSFVAVAIGGAAVIGAGASIAAGSQQASAQRDASRRNRQSMADTNRANLMLDLFRRGAPLSGPDIPDDLQGAQSALLPYYFGDAESRSAKNAVALYDAINQAFGSPSQEMSNYEAIISRYGPAILQNRELVNALASGRLTEDMLSESQPVFDARMGGVEKRRNASLEALQATLNEIDAIQAGKGYSGDTVGSRSLRFEGRRRIGLQSADDLSRAMLENALEKRAIQEQGRNLRLNNLNLPSTLAQSEIGMKQLPAQAAANRLALAMKPFDFYRVGNNFSGYQPLPQVQPVASTGQLVSQGVATGANTLNTYLLNRQLQQQVAAPSGYTMNSYGFAIPTENYQSGLIDFSAP